MKITLALALLFSSLAPLPAMAGSYTDAMSACLADNTTGKDRKDLAKWIFVAMAAHPELQGLAVSPDKTREQMDMAIGALVTKLLSQSCAEQTRNAMQKEGNQAMQAAFSSLGQLAMQELMSNTSVRSSVSGFEKYLDRKKLEAALATK